MSHTPGSAVPAPGRATRFAVSALAGLLLVSVFLGACAPDSARRPPRPAGPSDGDQAAPRAGPEPAPAGEGAGLDCRVTLVFGSKGLAGVGQRWIMDQGFSAKIVRRHDDDGDGRLRGAELDHATAEARANLSRYQWFTWAEVDADPYRIYYVRDFGLSFARGRLVYSFFLPLGVAAGQQEREVVIAVHDPTGYARVILDPDVEVSGSPGDVVAHLAVEKVPGVAPASPPGGVPSVVLRLAER